MDNFLVDDSEKAAMNAFRQFYQASRFSIMSGNIKMMQDLLQHHRDTFMKGDNRRRRMFLERGDGHR